MTSESTEPTHSTESLESTESTERTGEQKEALPVTDMATSSMTLGAALFCACAFLL